MICCRQAFSFGIKHNALLISAAAEFEDDGHECASDAELAIFWPDVEALDDCRGVVATRDGDASRLSITDGRSKSRVWLVVRVAYEGQVRLKAMPQLEWKTTLIFHEQFEKRSKRRYFLCPNDNCAHITKPKSELLRPIREVRQAMTNLRLTASSPT